MCDNSRGYFYSATKDVRPVIGTGNYQPDITIFASFHDYGFTNIQAAFGLDNFFIGNNNEGNVMVKQVPVAMIDDSSFTWLGLLGLDSSESTFSLPTLGSGTDKQPDEVVKRNSLLQSMKDEGNIPSLSWSYHAGSYARMYSHSMSYLAV
jgi:hypothetical protein